MEEYERENGYYGNQSMLDSIYSYGYGWATRTAKKTSLVKVYVAQRYSYHKIWSNIGFFFFAQSLFVITFLLSIYSFCIMFEHCLRFMRVRNLYTCLR